MSLGTDGLSYTNLTSSIYISNTTNNTNYYGSVNIGCFICNTNIDSFTNSGIILSGGGSNGSIATNGTNAFTNNARITITNFINRTGAFLGGGGGGANGGWTANDGGKGGPGGPGGGGGGSGGDGMLYKNSVGATGGSIIANANNGYIGGGGGGGGPSGNGSAGTYSNGVSYAPGGTGGGSPGANGAFYTIGTAGPNFGMIIYTPSSNNCNINNFKYGGGGGGYGQGQSLSSGGGGYGGGNGSGYNKSNYIPYGGGGGGGGGYGSGHPWVGGNGGYSVCNNGIITNFINGQGGTKDVNYIYGPVFFYGNAPTNYSIYIQSAYRYGQLFCTGWGTTTGTIRFNIDKNSTITSSTILQYVLVGITPNSESLIPNRIKTSNGIIIWSLTYVAANSSIFGVYAYNLNIEIITTFQPYNIANSISTLYNSNYHHVALTILGTTHKLYFDGNMVATNINALNVFSYYPPIISQLFIGSAADLTYGFTGCIDDFKIFNSVLSALDISNICTNSPILPTITDLIIANLLDTNISVSFSNPTINDNYSYQVKISPSTITTASGTKSYLTISGLISNTLYQLYIIAINISTGKIYYSNAISFTTNPTLVTYTFANNLNTSSNVSISSYGEYTILTFLNTDSIKFLSSKDVPIGYVVVGGGGGAGWVAGGTFNRGTGGGGGGGVAYVNSYLNSNITCYRNVTYNINIGTGGLSGNWLRSSTPGNPSYIQNAATNTILVNANGGDRSIYQNVAGAGGTSSGGYINLTGGSGGALSNGSSISIVNIPNIGLSTYYGGGGAGSYTAFESGTPAKYYSGGAGGGGDNASPGTPNTGGGGGGQMVYLGESACQGYGGSGVVILYFPTYN